MTTTDEPDSLDIAQRICEAQRQHDVPGDSIGEQEQTDGVLLGVVPPHLRGLHSLLRPLAKEANARIKELEDAAMECDDVESFMETNLPKLQRIEMRNRAVQFLFWEALREHLPGHENYDGLEICPDWEVYGYNKEKAEEDERRHIVHSISVLNIER